MNISLEFYPPKDLDFSRTHASFLDLETFEPKFISITYGALGGSQERSTGLIKEFSAKSNVEIAAHLTLVGKSVESLDGITSEFKQLGIKKIVAIRGDSPDGIFKQHPDGFVNTADFVSYLIDKDFEVIVSAYPEPHPESTGFDFDLQLLKNKSAAGAKKAITQFCFSNGDFEKLIGSIKKESIDIEMIAGIMPIYDIENVCRMADRCGTKVPNNIINKFSNNQSKNRSVAIEVCIDQINFLQNLGIDSFHFYTLNKSTLLKQILLQAGG
tara:strand:- start:13852 stop:14661 length:810 start_codon:yes stop_codon:yes gene_type:complete